ncbi:hypothetical protein FT663_01424 [Candidozyma haemuli var. vulneris]|uniref:Uncharacterized protein n=1 Tax=Candidozyma haemuli TaxID=45357 RepID=A0A2V1AZ44_9ASCO|nr:hypothetical protein CXQ85_002734 [[Candida] haemuloni]KAF3992559.1 hypothetical protein FT662_01105 [[Candida] haemuloni var. vulneris]KAF3994511.1 hypothetical protein FT663_01424 [[Candida] haemuloni var. vulneris]PVH23009.1 hypothetical protein CXQ85_002734 [[Candida] haemuloni]
MHIPNTPQTLVSNLVQRDVKSTAESFKSWDTCMDNTTCKIVAIVGIVLAVLVVISILTTLFRCCCLGLSCAQALCCCCSRGGGSRRRSEPRQVTQDPFHNANMYPRSQPMSQAQPAYYPVDSYDSYHKPSPYNVGTGYRAT